MVRFTTTLLAITGDSHVTKAVVNNWQPTICDTRVFMCVGNTTAVLVLVPDPKLTPAWIAFSIDCYTGSDIHAG